MRISVWRESTSLSAISCLSFSAPTYYLSHVRILTGHNFWGFVEWADRIITD